MMPRRQAAQRLERLGLITAEDRQYSRQGLPKARLSAAPEGHRAARNWLRQLAAQLRTATGSGRGLLLWRHESVRATLRFLDTLLAAAPPTRPDTAHAAAAR